MAVDTTQWTRVSLPPMVAQALWAAMYDDDDLADEYVTYAVVHALDHLIRDLCREAWSDARYARIMENLGHSKAYCVRNEVAMAKRFETYLEPPF